MGIRESHTPRKRFGQNFLQDPFIVENIIQAIHPTKTDKIIEIGPGLGVITKPLLAMVEHLDVIEIDRDLSAALRVKYPDPNQLTIHNQDILTFDLSAFHQQSASIQKFNIVGNLPYNISTPLIFHLLQFSSSIESMYFMLQKEVVDRIVAPPNHAHYGRLSIMTQYHCEATALFDVPPTAFYPAPKVQSAFIRLVPYASPPLPASNLTLLRDITRTAFTQRRKTLANALKPYLKADDFTQLGIDSRLRPEVLPIAEFVRISNYVDEQRRATIETPT